MKRVYLFCIASALLSCFSAYALEASLAPNLHEQLWTTPGAGLAHRLTYAPSECLALPMEDDRRRQIDAGRALFRSSVLLGGPAARLGLSCHACHTNGRSNDGFFLPELTDRAGAADVTSEWTSAIRGDGILNPVAIPDLVDAGGRESFGSQRDPSLAHFMRGVIEEEFQGPALPPAAFQNLMAYVQSLGSRHCPKEKETPITLHSMAEDIRRTLETARALETEVGKLLLFAAQENIGQLVERLPVPVFAAERKTLEGLARELGALRGRETFQVVLDSSLPGWLARFDATITGLEPKITHSYFDEVTLGRALSGENMR